MPIVDLPLNQRNIIITRSKEGILDIKKIFISKGANVFDLPAISIGDPDDFNPLDEALNQINDFHWIIFSSSNGIKLTNVVIDVKRIGLNLACPDSNAAS